jgi:hypothetical protein
MALRARRRKSLPQKKRKARKVKKMRRGRRGLKPGSSWTTAAKFPHRQLTASD